MVRPSFFFVVVAFWFQELKALTLMNAKAAAWQQAHANPGPAARTHPVKRPPVFDAVCKLPTCIGDLAPFQTPPIPRRQLSFPRAATQAVGLMRSLTSLPEHLNISCFFLYFRELDTE